jgi:hypothetical protein
MPARTNTHISVQAQQFNLPFFGDEVVLDIYVGSPNTPSKEKADDSNKDIHCNQEL